MWYLPGGSLSFFDHEKWQGIEWFSRLSIKRSMIKDRNQVGVLLLEFEYTEYLLSDTMVMFEVLHTPAVLLQHYSNDAESNTSSRLLGLEARCRCKMCTGGTAPRGEPLFLVILSAENPLLQ
jgi:hypothetical protein